MSDIPQPVPAPPSDRKQMPRADSTKGLIEVAEALMGRPCEPDLAQELFEAEMEGGWIVGGLWPGDTFEHDGEVYEVVEINETDGHKTVRDGRRFLEPRVQIKTATPKGKPQKYRGPTGDLIEVQPTVKLTLNPFLIVSANLTDEHFANINSAVKDQATGGWY